MVKQNIENSVLKFFSERSSVVWSMIKQKLK